ncbi:hypothetical protein NDU88_010150 [Pleurodeles waltl]|uniref:Uncharacterized protein n=1 Tax=Pleurodeles waltl TaxID=8319 RepID=A0AAV7QZG6_PLEWA|nr:hypothetical protein NDU88_010150 [Pleurodeles waltl]
MVGRHGQQDSQRAVPAQCLPLLSDTANERATPVAVVVTVQPIMLANEEDAIMDEMRFGMIAGVRRREPLNRRLSFVPAVQRCRHAGKEEEWNFLTFWYWDIQVHIKAKASSVVFIQVE